MRGLVMAALLASSVTQAQAPRIEAPTRVVAPITVQLDGVPTGSLVVMLLRDIMRVPYAISPDVLADRRPISVRLVMPLDKVPERVVGFLRNNGLAVRLDGGTVYVGRSGRAFNGAGASPGRELQNPARGSASIVNPTRIGGDLPSGSPLDPGLGSMRPPPRQYVSQDDKQPAQLAGDASIGASASPPVDQAEAIVGYIPAHRSPSYLAEIVGSVLPRLTFGARGDVKPDQAQASILPTSGPDVLVIAGTKADIERAVGLVKVLDRARPMVSVKAVVVQASDIVARGSALSVLASFAGGKVGAGSFAADPPGAQFVRLAVGGVTAVLSAVKGDSRFKIIATPNLAALSGAVATMNSGSQVPTVGSVSIAEGGTPVQSIEYRDSGITLTIRPVVRGELIELDVKEERSTFVRTETGVSNSPTLQKSSASASVILKSGESVVLAGLTEKSDEARRSGVFGGLLGVRSRDRLDAELLVVITAEVVPSPEAPPGEWVAIG